MWDRKQSQPGVIDTLSKWVGVTASSHWPTLADLPFLLNLFLNP
jgi:hypothetical protein